MNFNRLKSKLRLLMLKMRFGVKVDVTADKPMTVVVTHNDGEVVKGINGDSIVIYYNVYTYMLCISDKYKMIHTNSNYDKGTLFVNSRGIAYIVVSNDIDDDDCLIVGGTSIVLYSPYTDKIATYKNVLYKLCRLDKMIEMGHVDRHIAKEIADIIYAKYNKKIKL